MGIFGSGSVSPQDNEHFLEQEGKEEDEAGIWDAYTFATRHLLAPSETLNGNCLPGSSSNHGMMGKLFSTASFGVSETDEERSKIFEGHFQDFYFSCCKHLEGKTKNKQASKLTNDSLSLN